MDRDLNLRAAARPSDGAAYSNDARGRAGPARHQEGRSACLTRTWDSVRAIGPLALLGLALVGCVPPSLAGQWRSTSSPSQIEVTLSVHGTRVSGSGTFLDGYDRSRPLSITGDYTAPTFWLQLASEDQIVGRYIGRLDLAGTLRGVLSYANVPADSVILTRTPGNNVRPLFQPVW